MRDHGHRATDVIFIPEVVFGRELGKPVVIGMQLVDQRMPLCIVDRADLPGTVPVGLCLEISGSASM